jgi:hypothetical protein
MSLRRRPGREVLKANLRCTVGRFENCGPPSSARPETNKEPSCSEIEVIMRDFESGPGVLAGDGAFAFGSRRDTIELGARILYVLVRSLR